MLYLFKRFEGPIPERCNINGLFILPAEHITSLLAKIFSDLPFCENVTPIAFLSEKFILSTRAFLNIFSFFV